MVPTAVEAYVNLQKTTANSVNRLPIAVSIRSILPAAPDKLLRMRQFAIPMESRWGRRISVWAYSVSGCEFILLKAIKDSRSAKTLYDRPHAVHSGAL